ncbi:hypothetical protein P3102_21810 [Amycolatopsis sp. QT-25]|uniref:hypothetical protein n=1 Tax=Amycolatopsis sp. QT-25 TaxID=3034022 RepID=UPI0023ECB1BE|nr:hypothetical protein [Amycolatopsis sp. QT-25]WET76745.1 hypothetical protein P3102_21810 [Amycolatopsis sp. QT-25]
MRWSAAHCVRLLVGEGLVGDQVEVDRHVLHRLDDVEEETRSLPDQPAQRIGGDVHDGLRTGLDQRLGVQRMMSTLAGTP